MLSLGAALAGSPAGAASPLFELDDPRGDDHGDGKLVYPGGTALQPGELDLLSFSARAERDGTWFVAVFARPVRQPAGETVDQLGTQLDAVARLGFYTFNLDVYIDTDRQPGSGGRITLPGRHAEVDPASAWERAVVLTPRPHEARGELKRMLMRDLTQELRSGATDLGHAEADALRAQIPADVEQRIYFPHQVRVRGNQASFFVPAALLGGPARPEWSYVVAVSGATLVQSLDLGRNLGRDAAMEDSLMILPVAPGRWSDRFGGGREGAPNQPPLVDILVPKGTSQEAILSDFDRDRPVLLPGVVPAEQR
jgi:hypothetical protein